MAKTGQISANAQFTQAELKEKHENHLKELEALIERNQKTKEALINAKIQAAARYIANPTKKNYKNMKVAARRAL